MTITEAGAVNTLLHWAMGDCPQYYDPPTKDEALQAARILAGKAHKALSAGLCPEDVDDLSPYRPRR